MEGSLLPSTSWTDFYDLTMTQVFLNFPDAEAGFVFINRDNTNFPIGFGKKLRRQFDLAAYAEAPAGFTGFLTKTVGRFVKPSTIQWYNAFRFDPTQVTVLDNGQDIYFQGPLVTTSLWEIPGMFLPSWLYFQETGQVPDKDSVRRICEKARRMQDAGVRWVDFGTRRSFSRHVHETVVEIMMEYRLNDQNAGFISTSNMELAQRHDLTPSGTMGHKLIMVNEGLFGIQSANEMMMKQWQDEFQGNLGTVLPDTLTTRAFLRDFNSLYSRLFDSIRHDSGDPYEFTDLVIAHYRKLKIDPASKTIIFSDGLNVDTVLKLAAYCKGKIDCSFGIGTNLTNDVGAKPLNIVVKLDKIRKDPDHPWVYVAKLSDTPGKATGRPDAVAMAQKILEV